MFEFEFGFEFKFEFEFDAAGDRLHLGEIKCGKAKVYP